MGVDTDCRLVQHQYFGLVDDGLRDADPLPETLGELANLSLPVVAKAANVDDIAYAGPYPGCRHTPQRPHIFQIVGHGHVGIQRHGFGQIADFFAHFKRLLNHVVTIERDRPLGWRQESRQDAHSCGLPGAVRPEESQDLAPSYVKADVLDCRVGPVIVCNVCGLNHWSQHGLPACA